MAQKHEASDDVLNKGRSVGTETRELFEEMQAMIKQLQAMCAYAHDNGFNETEKRLTEVLESFDKLKRRYGSAEVLNDIKTTAASPRLFKAMKMNQQIVNARSALVEAKKTMGMTEKKQIISLLMKSDLQLSYEHFNDFFSPLNKFELFLMKLENFEKKQIKERAKNAPQFSGENLALRK